MGGAFTRERRGLRRPAEALLLMVLTIALGCQSYDPATFDKRLREATFDAYVKTIGTQFGGLGPADVTVEELSSRYRGAAIGAETPEAFYRELRALLADLDDPHSSLQVSPRFWAGPVAEPEWVQFVREGDFVWIGMPEASLRTPGEMKAQLNQWTRELGVENTSQLDPKGIAALLRTSTAYDPRRLAASGIHRFDPFSNRDPRLRPLRWMKLLTIDGRAVESPHDAELLIRGGLGSITLIEAILDGPQSTPHKTALALMRNAGVFESEDVPGGVRRRLNPLELADKLDPDGAGQLARVGLRSPTAAGSALRRARGRSAFRLGRKLFLSSSDADGFGLEAWLLRTPGGRPTAYVKVGSFRHGEGDRLALDRPLKEAIDALRGIEHWIVDVTQNPGGSWQEAGLFVSYFLNADTEVIPHVVTSIKTGGNLLFRTRIKEVHRLARVDVAPVETKTVHVLMDQDTASAGEIVASTLRGSVGAVLVGEKTAGAEFSTAEFEAPDGSVLRIGLSGGMVDPYESFQGLGLRPDISVLPYFEEGAPRDLEVWRTVFRYQALRAALANVDAVAAELR